MVTFSSLIVTSFLLISGPTFAFPSTSPLDLPVGEFFRPTEGVSGVPGTNAPYKRSPCPALNALANHGFLPRSGEGLTGPMVIEAVHKHYQLTKTFAALLTEVTKATILSPPFDKFSLADISKHNRIEHDASLVHTDTFFGTDPAHVNASLAEAFLALDENKDGFIGVRELGNFRQWREKDSKDNNPTFTFDPFHQTIAYGESALILNVLGRNERISLEHARSFMVEERIPSDYRAPEKEVNTVDLLPTVAKLRAVSAV